MEEVGEVKCLGPAWGCAAALSVLGSKHGSSGSFVSDLAWRAGLVGRHSSPTNLHRESLPTPEKGLFLSPGIC